MIYDRRPPGSNNYIQAKPDRFYRVEMAELATILDMDIENLRGGEAERLMEMAEARGIHRKKTDLDRRMESMARKMTS